MVMWKKSKRKTENTCLVGPVPPSLPKLRPSSTFTVLALIRDTGVINLEAKEMSNFTQDG